MRRYLADRSVQDVYKRQMFRCECGHCPRANKLILRLQPNEGILLKFGIKVPGPGFDVKQVMMDFSYSDFGGLPAGDAYARLIEDCIQGPRQVKPWHLRP